MIILFSQFVNENKINTNNDGDILLNALKDATGAFVNFQDKYSNDKPFDEASEILFIYPDNIEVDGSPIKHIKLPKNKSSVTIEWCLEKLNNENIYKSFVDNFKKILYKTEKSASGTQVYPTTYGIGVFSFSGNKSQETIKKILDDYDIKYTEEWSDSRYVYRYKISKSKDNLDKIKKLED